MSEDEALEEQVANFVAVAAELRSRSHEDGGGAEVAAGCYYEAAELLWKAGHQSRAEKLLRKALRLDPDQVLALRLLQIMGRPPNEPPATGMPARIDPVTPPREGVERKVIDPQAEDH